MNRKHTVEFYLSIIEKIKKINPEISFSSDFIIGYPGEEKDDFEKTIELINKIQFINSFSFIFSSRPGTTAYKLNKIDNKISKNRLKIIQENLFSIQLKKNKQLIGETVEVLVENKLKKQNKFFGRTKKMRPVIFDSEDCNFGELIKIKITSANQNNLFGIHTNKKFKAA